MLEAFEISVVDIAIILAAVINPVIVLEQYAMLADVVEGLVHPAATAGLLALSPITVNQLLHRVVHQCLVEASDRSQGLDIRRGGNGPASATTLLVERLSDHALLIPVQLFWDVGDLLIN